MPHTTFRPPFTPQEAPPPRRGAHYHHCACGNFLTCYSLPDQCPQAERWQCPTCDLRTLDDYLNRQQQETRMAPSHDQQARLDRYATAILRDGPTRVIVDSGALGVTPKRAREEYNITPDVIFIRNDGWSLGAPARFEQVALALWRDDWIGIIRCPDTRAQPWPEDDHGDLRV